MAERTPEEEQALTELAKNYLAAGRVKKLFTAGLLWLAGIVVAWFVLWDNLFSKIRWR